MKTTNFVGIVVLVFVLDIVSKEVMMHTVGLGSRIQIFPGLNLWVSINQGVSFGTLSSYPLLALWVQFCAVACLLVLLHVTIRWRRNWMTHLGGALLIGGALGNLGERFVRGGVVDFIDFYVGDWHYPSFNVADIALCFGALLIGIVEYKRWRDTHAKELEDIAPPSVE